MVLSWGSSRHDMKGNGESTDEASSTTHGSATDGLPGSPCLTYLKSPVVIGRLYDERTGLLPIRRHEPRAAKMVKTCQLVAVVSLCIAAAIVIGIYCWPGRHLRSDGR